MKPSIYFAIIDIVFMIFLSVSVCLCVSACVHTLSVVVFRVPVCSAVIEVYRVYLRVVASGE